MTRRAGMLVLALLMAPMVPMAADAKVPRAGSQVPRPGPQDPPSRYDYPYPGKLRTFMGPESFIRRNCGLWAWACTMEPAGGVCTIYIQELGPKVNLAGQKALIRHEVGHCNGWPGNHPGG